jgi:hypothetical protein
MPQLARRAALRLRRAPAAPHGRVAPGRDQRSAHHRRLARQHVRAPARAAAPCCNAARAGRTRTCGRCSADCRPACCAPRSARVEAPGVSLPLAWEMWQNKAEIPLWMPWITSVTVRPPVLRCKAALSTPQPRVRSPGRSPRSPRGRLSLPARVGASRRSAHVALGAVHGAVRADARVCVDRA